MKLTPLSLPQIEVVCVEDSYHSRLLFRGSLGFKYTDNGSEEGALLRKVRGAEGWCHQSKETLEI